MSSRVAEISPTNTLRLGDVAIDLVERKIHGRGAPARTLTVLEATFLRYLAERRGSTVEREELLARVWGYAPNVVTRAVDNTVARLRQKIEADAASPRWLTSSRGGGYRLEAEPKVASALPEEPSSFVGRNEELERVRVALDTSAVVVLVGLGGIGKSRVALRAARAFESRGAGDAAVVALGGARDRAEVLGRIGAALGIPTDNVVRALEGRTDLLLVLDEVEHLANNDLAFVGEVVGPRFLLTSQRPIGVGQRVELGPMHLSEAAELVAARSPVSVSQDDAARVAVAVDQVPFVAELAARWLSVGSPADVVARLAELRGHGPGKHDTVSAALSGSWELLSPAGRALLVDAALFAGPFTLGDLEQVSGQTGVLDLAAELLARGWLQRTGEGLVVLSVVRRYLADQGQLPAEGPLRMARWLLGWAPRAVEALRKGWDPVLHARLSRAEPDLRRALEVVEGEEAVEVLLALHYRPLHASVPHSRALDEIDRVHATLSPTSDLMPRLMLLRANLLWGVGELDRAGAEVVQARELYEQTAAPIEAGRGAFAGALGNVRALQGRFDEALELYREAVQRLTAGGSYAGASTFRINLASRVWYQPPELEVLLLEAIGTMSGVAHPALIGIAHCNLANLYNDQGRFEAAASHYDRARVVLEEVGDRNALARTLSNQAMFQLNQGNLAEAWNTAEEAWRRLRAIGVHGVACSARLTQSQVRLEQGRGAEALELALSADADLERLGATERRPVARWRIGQALLWLERLDLALGALEAASESTRGVALLPAPLVDRVLAHLAAGNRSEAERIAARVEGPGRPIVDAALAGSPIPTLPEGAGTDVRVWTMFARRLTGRRSPRGG